MRVAEYVAQALAELGVRHVFMLTGGGAMFLNDALGHRADIVPVFCHHEQACAMAAEAYARIAGRLAVVNVTTGPGGLNALNGVFGAWTDSVPLLVVSGQVKRETCLEHLGLSGLRQLGDQEAEIIRIVTPITKYAALVSDPGEMAWHLDQAIHHATHGRPGPCWLDIPIDVQAAQVEPALLRRWLPTADAGDGSAAVDAACRAVLARVQAAHRPVLLAGSGTRAAGATADFNTLIRALGIPVVTAWTHDLIDSDDPLFCGRPGTIGTRAGNFTVQNADLVLVLGSRLNIRQVSYNWRAFAPQAYKIQVDVDPAEMAKPTVIPDLALCTELKPFMRRLTALLGESGYSADGFRDWLSWCRARVSAYPVVRAEQRKWAGAINPYHFVEVLFGLLDSDDIVACGNATACIVPFQVAHIRYGQRLFSNSGSASMGYDLPAAIGAYYGALVERGQQRRVVCVAGDGSLQLNIQELQTIASCRIPVKIVVLDNRGYLSIRSSQNNFFGRLTGAGPESGVGLPDYVRVAEAYGIPAIRLDGPEFAVSLADFLAASGAGLCQVVLDPAQGFEPRMSSRQLEDGSIVTPPLEDMYPFLPREELAGNMLRPSDEG